MGKSHHFSKRQDFLVRGTKFTPGGGCGSHTHPYAFGGRDFEKVSVVLQSDVPRLDEPATWGNASARRVAVNTRALAHKARPAQSSGAML